MSVDPGPDEDGGRPYPDPTHSIAPRKPRTVGGVFFLAVLAAAALGLVLVAVGPWRAGLSVIGCGLLGGALARLVIPRDNAGMLGIRRKFFDVITMLALGVALLVLAQVIPNQPRV